MDHSESVSHHIYIRKDLLGLLDRIGERVEMPTEDLLLNAIEEYCQIHEEEEEEPQE